MTSQEVHGVKLRRIRMRLPGLACLTVLVFSYTVTIQSTQADTDLSDDQVISNDKLRHTVKKGWWRGKSECTSVKCRARKRACGSTKCSVPGCGSWIFYLGWHINGKDLGCCSNYNGCCKLASTVCYYHDVMCLCCQNKIFCGPLCKKHVSCSG